MAPAAPPSEVSLLLEQRRAGRAEVLDDIFPLVYDELRRLAASRLRGERAGHTLQTTALVHEAYLRLAGPRAQVRKSRAVHGRRRPGDAPCPGRQRPPKRAAKRGAGEASTSRPAPPSRSRQELIALDGALEVAELDYGRPVSSSALLRRADRAETAAALEPSDATIHREWRAAKRGSG